MLVLEVEERICGFAVARSVLDEAELMLIAVPQKMRGRGYGRALLDKVIVECRRRNVRRIYLEVRSDNENAGMLYESAGFRPVGRRCRSEEHTSELQSLMRISYAVFCLKKKKKTDKTETAQLYKYG